MEASVAAPAETPVAPEAPAAAPAEFDLAGAISGQPATPAEAPSAPAEQPQGQDAIAQMAEQMQGFTQTHEEMRDFLRSQQEQRETADPGEPELDGLDLSGIAAEPDPAKAAQMLQQVIENAANQRTEALLKERLDPITQQVSDMRASQESDALVAEFPQLAQPEVAQQTVKAAEQYAAMMGRPELATDIPFLRLTYMAARASEHAQQQQSGAATAPPTATLEGAGGASPATQQGQVNPSDAIAQNWSQRRSVLPKF